MLRINGYTANLKCEHFYLKVSKLISPKHLLHLWTYTQLCIVAAGTDGQQQYHGILINSEDGGTQLYDPFNAPNAHGDLSLGLQTGYSADLGAAVINGPLAYFASASPGRRVHHMNYK